MAKSKDNDNTNGQREQDPQPDQKPSLPSADKTPAVKPTVGRIVLYQPPDALKVEKRAPDEKDHQPWAAIITHVNADGTVDLSVFAHPQYASNCTMQPSRVAFSDVPTLGHCWWPPRS